MPETLLKQPSDTVAGSIGGASISQPKIEPDARELYSSVRAISSVDQIYLICEAMFNPTSIRNKNNGIIADQFNDSPPFPSGYLKQKGQRFRHNFSTGFMSGILEPAINSPVDIIDQAQYLTSASLSEEDDPTGEKTEAYRRKFTKLVRSWDGWRTHIYNNAQEVVVWGYGAVVCDDPDDWRPQECRQDEFGLPDNTGQYSSMAQFAARKKSFLIHELIKNLKDRQSAEAAGWYVNNCIEALNEAMPQDRATGSGGEGQAPSSRTFVDLVRDGNAGASHDPRARTVDVYILWATESDGRVSKFIVTQNGRRQLYESYDEFEKMSDVIVFYSLNPGSGTLYSSKGGGRKLINLAKSQERGRNKAADAAYMAGLVWIWSPQGMIRVQLKVFDSYAIIEGQAGAELAPQALPDNSEVFDKMDERLTRYAEQTFGAYIPQKPPQPGVGQSGGDKKTAHEVVIEAQRESIARAGWLKRFFGQFGDEMSMIARKAGNPDTRDEEAKAWQKDMFENDQITPELLKKLVEQPQGQLVQDMTSARTQALSTLAPLMLQSPFFDKYKLERELSIRGIGKELTNILMFKNGIDPTDEAAQINKQILENSAIRSGESPNIVPSDNHKIHSKWLISDLKQSEPGIAAAVGDGTIDPKILDNVQTAIKHGEAHVVEGEKQSAVSKNADDTKEFAQHKAFYIEAQKRLDAALQHMVDRRKQGAQPPQPTTGAPSPQMPAAPPGASAAQPSPNGKEPMWGGMSEKVITAWIAQYDKLPDAERARLEAITGLGSGQRPPAAPNQTLTSPKESVTTTAAPTQ